MIVPVLLGMLVTAGCVGLSGAVPTQELSGDRPPSSTPSAATALTSSPTALALPPGCSPPEVERLITRFLDAFNRGNADDLAAFFPARNFGGELNASTIDLFQAYTVAETAGMPAFVADDRAELLAYFAERHARHERLELNDLKVTQSWARGHADFSVHLTRQADDPPQHVALAKGSIVCRAQQFVIWQMGPASST